MTSLDVIYKAFLNKVKDDDWDDASQLVSYEKTWKEYLLSAINLFKFPRVDLTYNEQGEYLEGDLSNNEIQILAEYMRAEWLQGNISTWENIKEQYHEADFSQANFLDKLDKTYKTALATARRRESNYYRSIGGQPFNYSDLAGDNDG